MQPVCATTTHASLPSRRMAQPSSSSAGQSSKSKGENDALSDSVPKSIDDVVSLVRSVHGDRSADGGTHAQQRQRNPAEALLQPLIAIYQSQKGKGRKMLANMLQDGVDPLQMLDPTLNTLGFTFVLAARCLAASDAEDAHRLVPYVARFAQSFNADQWIGAGEIVTALTQGIVNVATVINDLVWANPSLLRIFDGFRSISGGPNNLTTLHPIVLYHLLRTAHYETAVDWILQHDIVSANVSASPLRYLDVLEYFYYGGLVCVKVGDLQRASVYFEQCVCSPAQAVSAIHIDAYKKLILVQLLDKGKTSALSSSTSSAIQKAIRSKIANVDVYQSFARAYSHQPVLHLHKSTSQNRAEGQAQSDEESLQTALARGKDTFMADQNFGLIRRLLTLHPRRRLQHIGKTFSCISSRQIVQLLQMCNINDPDALAQACVSVIAEVRQAHAAGWLQASILDADGMAVDGEASDVTLTVVHFGRNDADYSSVQSAQRLMTVMKESQRWNNLVAEKERQIAQSEAYLAKLVTLKNDRLGAIGADDLDDDAFA